MAARVPERVEVPRLDLSNVSSPSLEPATAGVDTGGRRVREGIDGGGPSSQKVAEFQEEHPISAQEGPHGSLSDHHPSAIPSSSHEADIPHLRDEAILHHATSSSSSASSSSSSSYVMSKNSTFGELIYGRLEKARISKSETLEAYAVLGTKIDRATEKANIDLFLAGKPKKKEAIAYLNDKINALSSKEERPADLISSLVKLKDNLDKASTKSYKMIVKNYKETAAQTQKTLNLYKSVQRAAFIEIKIATEEEKKLRSIEPGNLDKHIRVFLNQMRPPLPSDFSSRLEGELCLEGFKNLLLDPEFKYVDSHGVEWKGGELESLSGGSGGVYALGLQRADNPTDFKKFLVAKVVSEEPGSVFGDQKIFTEDDKKALVDGVHNPSINPLDYNAEVTRAGIAPGKGVVNEYLASKTPFSSGIAVMTEVEHPALKDKSGPQKCCVINFVKSEGDHFSLVEADMNLWRLGDDGDKDEIEKQQKMIKKATSLGIAQDSNLRDLEGRLDLTGFEDQMLLNILTRNQDVASQNFLLVSKGPEIPDEKSEFTLVNIDHGATFSSIYSVNNRMPAWENLAFADKKPFDDPRVQQKISTLNADVMIAEMKSTYQENGFRMDIGAENALRASIALLKSTAKRDDLSYKDLAVLTFEQKFDYSNVIEKAIRLCSDKLERDFSGKATSSQERSFKFDEYLLQFFEDGCDKMDQDQLKVRGYLN